MMIIILLTQKRKYNMRVTIWDLDYYYAKIKRNCYNVDAMKISSYHKQRGDTVTFVLNEYDIHRPYDLYYIIKVKNNTRQRRACN